MSAEDPNPAATPTPCEDTQGDERWMSLVCEITLLYLLIKELKFPVFYIAWTRRNPYIFSLHQYALLEVSALTLI